MSHAIDAGVPGPTGGVTRPVHAARAAKLLAGLVACWIPVLLLRGTVADVAALHALGDGVRPYVVLDRFLPLYVLSPIVFASAAILLLSPGLLLAIALDRAKTVETWVLHGFALSLVVVSAAAAVAQALVPIGAAGFIAVVAACTLAAFALLLWSLRHRTPAWPFDAGYATSTVAWMVGVPVVLLAALVPKFYWENFNGDGAHAFEAARLLLHQPVPFWPEGSGEIGGFPGLTSALYAYPTSWFIRLFGPLEVSARLPYLLYLPALYGAIVGLIAWGRAWVPRQAERLIVWLHLTIYTMVVAYSATYSPYSADIALPATQDTLLVVCFFGFSLATLRRDWGWFALFALLTFTSLPNGLLLIAFLCVPLALTRRLRRTWACLIAIAAFLLFAVVTPRLLVLFGLPAPGGEYGGGGLLVRFAFLQLLDVKRFLYLLIPCGILPALSLVLWKRMDEVARLFAVVTALAFLFAYVQAHAPLHYYIPAMLLPIVVYWRLPRTGKRRPLEIVANIAAAIVAFALALPAETDPFTDARAVGQSMDVRVGDWAAMDPEAFRASTLIHEIIPYDWNPAVPEAAFGGSPLVFHYYARNRPAGAPVNYVIQRAGEPGPQGFSPIATDGEFTAWMLSDDVWRSHLALRPPTPAGSPWLAVPRGILFRTEPLPEGFPLISLPAIAERLGIDVNALARRLGVE